MSRRYEIIKISVANYKIGTPHENIIYVLSLLKSLSLSLKSKLTKGQLMSLPIIIQSGCTVTVISLQENVKYNEVLSSVNLKLTNLSLQKSQ